jgi:hypothetical protein
LGVGWCHVGLAIDNVTGPFGDGVKILLCLDLFFTVPIVMTAPRELLDQAILPRVSIQWKTFAENAIRLGCVCVFTGLALLSNCYRHIIRSLSICY